MSGNLDKNPLWGVLVDAVHNLPLYRNHKNYIKEVILPEKPNVKPEEISERLGMPLGETMVILVELDRGNSGKKD